jgi:hypothetical protein
VIPLPPPSYEQTIEAVTACGIARADIVIRYEDVLQSDVVIIADLGGADEKRFHCLRKAIHPFYILEIEQIEQRSAYYAFSEREDHKQARIEALVWLRQNDLLDSVPKYDPALGLAPFARGLEQACSLPVGEALEVAGANYLTFKRDFLRRELEDNSGDWFTCLQHFLAASNAYEHGIRLVFIGNEAIPE